MELIHNAILQVSKYSVMSVSSSAHGTMSSANIIDPGTSFLTPSGLCSKKLCIFFKMNSSTTGRAGDCDTAVSAGDQGPAVDRVEASARHRGDS